MAIDLTGINNVGEFYSHHYLDALLDKDLKGLFGSWKKEDEQTPDKRLNRCATEYFRAKSQAMKMRRLEDRVEASHRLHVQLLEALGYPYEFGVQYLNTGGAVPVLSAVTRSGAPYLWLLETVFSDPDDSPLDNLPFKKQYPQHEEEARDSRPQAPWEDVIGEIFRTDQPPRWLIFFAGRFIYLIDRTKWGQGQYLLFDLDEIFGTRQADTLRATAALLSRDALAPQDGVAIHDTLDENSHKHAYGVSSDLKYGVRKAVELLANEYIWYQRNIGKQALFTDENLATELTRECLRYLYRMLFLFYAEARSSELGLVPMRAEAYRAGYSLEALRDLEQVPLNTPQARDGYYLNDSLNQLFKLINDGYPEIMRQMALEEAGQPVYDDYGFTINGLQSPLFDAATTPRLSSARFRNSILQEILQQLSLSQEKKGRKVVRGRISYAQLGINQLGAVYEGLLSYSGFFAQERLYVVKRAQDDPNNESTQFYYIPERDLEKYKTDEFVYEEGSEGSRRRQYYEKGSFIFRLAGRDRQKSASYYTPEVLTECVVKYSLKELLGESPEDENWKTADEILKLTLCEPAMGSGAFVNEAINQLADAYLTRKQAELGETISADDYRLERQKVKAHLALNNTYGVDMNPMAVELAQVSIWLNTIYDKMPAPWFNARLAVGNSLIGARRQVYSAEDVKSGAYAKKAPLPARVGEERPAGSIYHWLLPDTGMAAFDKDKVIRELAPGEVQAIKDWRKGFTTKFKGEEIRQLQQLSDWADGLWAQVVHDRQQLLAETREAIPLWGQTEPGKKQRLEVADKERKLRHFERANGPYRRLKLAMDYWCALWFWPIPKAQTLPARGEFLADMAAVLKAADEGFEWPARQMSLLKETERPYQESLGVVPLVNLEKLVTSNLRLATAQMVQANIRFQHWELSFAELFDERGGFDLILGNPPWIKLEWNEAGVLSDFEPLLAIRKMSASNVARQREEQFREPECAPAYKNEFVEANGGQSFLRDFQNYSLLKGVQTNLYKCFIVRSWELGCNQAVSGLLHPEGIYEDSRGGDFRSQVYRRLKRHFMFQNEIGLFQEVHHNLRYSVNVYRAKQGENVQFHHIVNLFHPTTVDASYAHDGRGQVPGIKNKLNTWELTGHRKRIVTIGEPQLATLGQIFEEKAAPPLYTRLPLIHSQELLTVLEKFANQPRRLGDLKGQYYSTVMWDETYAQRDGIIQRTCSIPDDANQWILSGPHIYVATPFYKSAKEGCSNNLAYDRIDLTIIPDDYLPRAVYTPACSPKEYAKRTPSSKHGKVTDSYRNVNREMLSQAGERTLVNAIVPPGAGNIHAIFSITFDSNLTLVLYSGLCSSMPYDFFVKSAGKGHLNQAISSLLPMPPISATMQLLKWRTLRLNCLTTHYADLWQDLFQSNLSDNEWTKTDSRLSPWPNLSRRWQRGIALRNEFERRQALVEIDVLASMALGLTLDELLTIYRVQFPVLKQNEQKLRFDQRGFVVPVKTVRGELVINESHPAFSAMVPPFTPVEREADYRRAWAFFEERLRDEKDTTAS